MKKRTVWFSVCGSLYTLIFLAAINFFQTSYPWALYCIPAVLLWPAGVCTVLLFPQKLNKVAFSWMITVTVSVYYMVLNLRLSSGFPWSFIVIATLLWYPFSVMLSKKLIAYSVYGFIWAVLFFTTLNVITTPGEIWAVYPIFGMFWWPLTVFFFGKDRQNDRN